MNKQFRTIVYISTATKLNQEDLERLLVHCKTNNNYIGISGILIYSKDFFFQIIEGLQEDVDQLFEKIKIDSRHFNLLKIFDVTTSNKKFERFNCNYITNNDEKATNELLKFLEINKNLTDETHNKIIQLSNCLLKDFK
ncbi:BLUF domain-containing protein [uncultured Aquimarina sp.]|uniref:BLUF domain-containing protein n=1 Tax=uncultured Aquimarina sp. TaxID=575652 RepID=UPI0026351832|nr:BLUF domain-containing protein [uncultured Aquimarina sp.]